MKRDDRIEYVKALLEWASSDVRQVYIRVTASLAVAVLFVTQIKLEALRRLDRRSTDLLFAGLGCLIGAALAYFVYVSLTHLARRKIARYLLGPSNSKDPLDLLIELSEDWGKVIILGNVTAVLGICFLSYVLVELVVH